MIHEVHFINCQVQVTQCVGEINLFKMKNSLKHFWDEAFRHIVLKVTVYIFCWYEAHVPVVSVWLVRISCPFNNCFVDICLISP